MSYARQLLDTYPASAGADAGLLATTIDALSDCAQACTTDVDADLGEQNVAEMVTCIRLCLECTDICTATTSNEITGPIRRDQGTPLHELIQLFICYRKTKPTGCKTTGIAFQCKKMFFVFDLCFFRIFRSAAQAIFFIGKQHHANSMFRFITKSPQRS